MGAGLTLGTVTSLTPVSSTAENLARKAIEDKFNLHAVHRDDLEHRFHYTAISHGGNGESTDDSFYRVANPTSSAQACALRRVTASIRLVGTGLPITHECKLQVEKATLVAGIPNYGAPTVLVTFATLTFSVADPGVGVEALRTLTYTLPSLKYLATDEEMRVRYAYVSGQISHVDVTLNLQSKLETET